MSSAPKKVLIIDDDKFTRHLFVSEFTQENMFVESAGNGEDGIEKVKTWKPDIVILDLILPGLDGFEVLVQTRKIAASTKRKIDIFVYSSLTQERDKKEAMELGATEYFIKEENTARAVVDAVHARVSKGA